jgi:hypothetical protein
MIDKVLDGLPPELRVMAEVCEQTLEDDERADLNNDLGTLFDCLQNGDEETAKELLAKWNAPEECFGLLAMALGFKAMQENGPIHDQD